MKIKRFFAADIRQAMRMVKDELGPDAVIMSNKSVDGGVEIFAARDFDPQALQEKVPVAETEAEAETQKSSVQKVIKKLFELPNYTAEKEKLHIISSTRKQGDIQAGAPKAKRLETETYLGYAEKAILVKPRASTIEVPAKLSDKTAITMPVKAVDFSEDRYSATKVREKEIIAQHPPKVAAEQKPVVEQKTVVEQKPLLAQAPTVEQVPAATVDLLAEMRNEFKQLNFSFASRLAEVSYVNTLRSNPVRMEVLHRLADMGISKRLSLKLANRLEGERTAAVAFAKAQSLLAKVLLISDDNIMEQGGVVALVGPTGVGKTTTIAKLAAKFILKHSPRQVALITTDNFRIGAHEQLTIYARILNVPIKSAANAQELRTLINGFHDKKLILIDTAGMASNDMRLAQQLMMLQDHNIPVKSYLVMSATMQYKAMQAIIAAFQMVEPTACIITKMDEADSKGAVISTLIERQLPVAFITNGQQVPEDIYIPHAKRLVEQCAAELDVNYDGKVMAGYEDWVTTGYA